MRYVARQSLSLAALTAVASMFPLTAAPAATHTWTSTANTGTIDWSDTARWSGSDAPDEAADTIVRFWSSTSGAANTTGSFTSRIDAATAAGGAATSSFDLEVLDLRGAGSSSGRIVTISGGGAHSLNFVGDNNQVLIANGNNIGYDITAPIAFANGLTIAGSAFSSTTDFGAISGTGGLSKSGNSRPHVSGVMSHSGGLTMNGGWLYVEGNNTFTGGTTLNGGILIVGHNSALSSGTLLLSGGALTPVGASRTLSNSVQIDDNIRLIDTAPQGGFNITLSGPVDLMGNVRTISVGAAGTSSAISTEQGILSGIVSNGGITKTGTGPLKLSNGASTYEGVTTVRQGVLLVGNHANSGVAGALGNATSAIELGDGSTASDNTIRLLIDGGFTVGRDVNVNGNNATGVTRLGGNTNGNATFSGTVTLSKSVELSSIAAGTNALTFSGDITGGFGVDVIGGGNTRFTNAKSYTGPTSVSAGTLDLDGSLANGNVTIGGTAVAKLEGSGTLNFNLNGDTADLISVLNQGTLDITGLTLALNISGVQTQSSYVIADYTAAGATLLGSEFLSVTGLSSGWQVDYGETTPNVISLTQVAVPEPTAVGALAIGALFLARRRRSLTAV